MKTFYRFTPVAFLIAMIFSSCIYTEEITFGKDGSGTISFKVDMSSIMEAQMEMEQKKDSAIRKKNYRKTDSIFYFSDYLDSMKDSIARLDEAEKRKLEMLRPFKAHAYLDEEHGKGFFEVIFDFDAVTELNDIHERMQLASTINLKNNNTTSGVFHPGYSLKYILSGRKFHRKVIIDKLTAGQRAEIDRNNRESLKFQSGSPYIFKYHFPKTIKSVSYPGAEISEDGKTLIINTVLDSVVLHPEKFDFTVKFHRK